MLNHIDIMGRMTRDPEIRYTQTQTPVVTFTLAVDRNFGKERATDFISCVAWRNTAEFIGKYFRKGSMMVVSGRLQIREWTGQDGAKRQTAEVVAENVYFGDSKRRDDNNAPGEGSYQSQPQEPREGGNAYGGGSSYGSAPSYGSYNDNSYGGEPAGFGNSPAADSAFADLGEGDGELPF